MIASELLIYLRGNMIANMITRLYDRALLWKVGNQYDRNMIEKHAFLENVYNRFALVAQGCFRFSLHQFHRKKATVRSYFNILVTNARGKQASKKSHEILV